MVEKLEDVVQALAEKAAINKKAALQNNDDVCFIWTSLQNDRKASLQRNRAKE